MPFHRKPPRDHGPTFDLGEIGWLDFETKSETDLKQAGAYRYATEANAIICTWSVGADPASLITSRRFGEALEWASMPQAFRDHHERVRAGEAVWASYNAGFDKAVWNYSTVDFPQMEPKHIIDVMAQAVAAGMPPDLAKAAEKCGGPQKQEDGKQLLALFCLPGAIATPQTHPDEWQRLLTYALGDIDAMRSVFLHTKQLPLEEWREYWAMEATNERGVRIDTKLAAHAATLATIDRKKANADLLAITGGAIKTVDSVQAMTNWLLPQLPDEGAKILTKREEEADEDGNVVKVAKYQLTRRRVGLLLAYVQSITKGLDPKAPAVRKLLDVERLLQIRMYGGSKTPMKYGKMVGQQVDGVLFGQYVFNGASQTGRASSRGVQVHNLARDVLPYEHEAIEALLDGMSYYDFAGLGDDTPVSRKLSLLIRPTFVAADGNVFCWSDWSNIEARVLPWVAGPVPGALARLEIFRAVDKDPSIPDLYTRTAATLSHVPIEEVTKALRQRGKVAELALGFGGAVGALQAMAAGYGMFFDAAEAKTIVDGWRLANKWCVDFWGKHEDDGVSYGLWGAICRAMRYPMSMQAAGRVSYTFLPDYFNGSLLCVLPSGRVLTYRGIKYDRVPDLDDDGEPTGTTSTHLRFSRGYGRVKLWHGLACENVVQAVAADILRGTLVRCEDGGFHIRLHTHDEILGEIPEGQAEAYSAALRWQMRRGFDWSEGLPIMSEETISPYYTKQEF